MKIEDGKLSINELLLVRQWLSMWESSMVIESKFIHQATAAKKTVDRLLWSELISKETPWGTTTVASFSDDNFEQTVKTILGKEEVNEESSKQI